MQLPDIPATEQLRTTVRLATRWSDEDNQSVLNNAVYMTLLEEARRHYFGSLGLLEENRFPFLLMGCSVRFVSPGRGGHDVDVHLATTSLGRSSLQQAYRVLDAETGAVLCEAEALLVTYDPSTRGSCPMSDSFRTRVAEREGLDSHL